MIKQGNRIESDTGRDERCKLGWVCEEILLQDYMGHDSCVLEEPHSMDIRGTESMPWASIWLCEVSCQDRTESQGGRSG